MNMKTSLLFNIVLFLLTNLVICKSYFKSAFTNEKISTIGPFIKKYYNSEVINDDENKNSKNDNENYADIAVRVKNPRIREPSVYNVYNSEDADVVYASVGDLVNLTCILHTKEIDWHFKDKNFTTIIISNGLQLQIVKPIHIHHHNHNHNSNQYQYSLKQTRNHDNTHDKLKHLFKYKVISDHNSFHLLSVYVQGKQDEGTYQCVDSKSETPIKKTIKLFLKSKSMRLKFNYINLINSPFSIYLIIFLIQTHTIQ